ncbi:MAG: hypothetical protein K9K39_08570 [Desulfohalobiaceae bacterium]|nr:hypothetical protein [Desulfohalobiaceae bacterium]
MQALRTASCLLLLGALALTSAHASQVPRMDKDQLKAILNNSDLILFDVRPFAQWAASSQKLPGAKHKDPHQARQWGQTLDRNKTVVTYCA